ncbi:MAG: hypothetical protein ACRENI_08145 [Gemmatimonadaceae bacterium]
MTLGELSCLLNVGPKWILNASAALDAPLPYTLPAAKRLAVARALHESLGMPMPRAYEMAADVLRRYAGGRKPVPLPGGDTAVSAAVDVYRILAGVNVGLSRLRSGYAPRRRGRAAAARGDALLVAADYGLDLTLLASNLGREPAERLRQLDAMAAFRRRVRRGQNSERGSAVKRRRSQR